MMRQFSGSGLFGGSGLKGKMMRKLTGMPDLAGFEATMVVRCRRCHHCPGRRLVHHERN